MAEFFDPFATKPAASNKGFFDPFAKQQQPAAEEDGGFMPAAKQAIGAGIKGLGQAATDFIPGVEKGNALSSYGQSVIDANPTAIRSLGDIADNPWTAVKEATGNALSSIGSMAGTRAAGMAMTAAAPFAWPFAPAVAGAGQLVANVGPIVAAALPSYGGIRGEQIAADPLNEQDGRSKAIALLGAGTVGAIEGSFGPQAWALAAMKKGGIEAVAKNFAAAKSLPWFIGKGALKGAAVEGAEELVQNPVEQIASYQDPTTGESLSDTALSGAMGAIGGGVLGGGLAGVSYGYREQQPTTPQQPAPQPVAPPSGPMGKAAVTAQQSGAVDAAAMQQAMQDQIAFDEQQAKQKGATNEQKAAQGPIAEAGQSISGAPTGPAGAGTGAGTVKSVPQSSEMAVDTGVGEDGNAARSAPDVAPSQTIGQPPIVQPQSEAQDTNAIDDEFAQFAMDEAKSLDATRHDIAGRQAIARRAKLEAADARVEGQRQREAEANRIAVMDSLPLLDYQNPVAAFEAELYRQGFRQSKATPGENAMIQRRVSAMSGLNQDEAPIPSAPNELTMDERRKAAVQSLQSRTETLIAKAKTPGARIKNGRILDAHGKSLATLRPGEEVALQPYVKQSKGNNGTQAQEAEQATQGRPAQPATAANAAGVDSGGDLTRKSNPVAAGNPLQNNGSVAVTTPAVKNELSGERISASTRAPAVKDSFTTAPTTERASPVKTPLVPQFGGIDGGVPTNKQSLSVAPTTSEGSRQTAVENPQLRETPNVAPGISEPAIDVSTRTDQQLAHLSTNGRTGYKEAAIAEIARRGGEVAESAPDAAGDDREGGNQAPLWKRTVLDAVGPQIKRPLDPRKLPRLEKIAKERPESLTDRDRAALEEMKRAKSARSKYLKDHKAFVERSTAHYFAVQDAKARGEEIPPAVRADYPHLFAAEEQAAGDGNQSAADNKLAPTPATAGDSALLSSGQGKEMGGSLPKPETSTSKTKKMNLGDYGSEFHSKRMVSNLKASGIDGARSWKKDGFSARVYLPGSSGYLSISDLGLYKNQREAVARAMAVYRSESESLLGLEDGNDQTADDKFPLYASRKVTNAAEIIEWAKSQGFKSTMLPNDVHVTVAYSSEPVSGSSLPKSKESIVVVGGKRTVEPLGSEGAVVLKFDSADMQERWKQYREHGASWDYDSYTPHVTISYNAGDVDLSKVKPYLGKIELGEESQEPLNVNKADEYKETPTVQPKPTLAERKAAALERRKAKEAATKAAEARTIAARAPEVASLADRLKAAAATAVGSRKAALEAILAKLERAKPDAQKSAKGFEAVAQRQVNAENRFVDSVVEQFGLSRDDATSAWNYYLKNKLVKVDSVGGQYNLTDGRLWDAGALKQAAAEFGSRQSHARTKGPSVIAQKTSPIMRRDDIVGEIMRITGGGGISPTMARDITGDSANRASKLRGLFTNRGHEDLDDIATNLQLAGYDVRDGNHLSELLREASFGNVAVSMERQERDKDSEKERQNRDRIRAIANRRGIKSVAVKFSALESQVFAMLEARTKKAVEMLDARSQARFDRALADARGLVSEDEIDSILADASRRGLKSREFWNSGANLIRGMVEDARFAKQDNEDDGYQIPDTPWIEDGDGRGNTTVSGADPFGGSDQEAADPFGLEGQSAEDIAKQEADRVAAEKAKQDEESQAAKDKKDAEKQSLAEKVKARAENHDNFQFGEDSKAAAKPMGGLFDQSTQSAKLDGANGTIKRPDSLNLLANPVAYGDTIQFSDGSKWVAKNGWTGGPGAWTLLQGKTQHPTVAGINGQSEFIRAIIDANEASKPTAEGGKQNGEGGKSAVEGGNQHRYALVNRPAGLGAIPKDMQYTVEPRPPAGQAHHDMARHGILVTDRALTKAEQESFELALIVEGKAEDALADQIASGSMSSYAERYVEKFSKNRELVVQAVMQQVERAGRYSIADRDAFVAKVVDRLKANIAKPAEKKENASDREAAQPWSVIKANSEWVKLGDGSHQFRYDGMGNGQVIDTHRSEGRSGANKWRTSDGELHEGLAAAKAHEIETHAKPNLRANGYLEKEAEAAPAKANAPEAKVGEGAGGADDIRYNQASQATITPSDSAIYDMAREGKSAQEILAFIGESARRRFDRYLAKALMNLGVKSTIKLDMFSGWKISHALPGKRYAAAYSPKTDTVAIFTPRGATQSVLHELVHAATLKALANPRSRAAIEMRRLFKHVQDNGQADEMYGMRNLDEFVAEAFSNPKFQQALKSIPAPSGSSLKSAWEWFVGVVARMLGMRRPAQATALDRAMVLGAAVMNENAAIAGNATGGNLNREADAENVSGNVSGDISDTITIDGVERPRLNSNGKPIAQTDEALRKFYAWFKNSKVVDEQGRPLVRYHLGEPSTQGFSTFRVGGRGGHGIEKFPLSGTLAAGRAGVLGLSSGPGIWFGDKRTLSVGTRAWNRLGGTPAPVELDQYGRVRSDQIEDAFGTGPATYSAYLSMQNPLVIKTAKQRVELKQRLLPYPESFRANDEFRPDFPFRFDGKQREQLVAEGWDGIILDIPGWGREDIAFSPGQIKSATGNTGEFSPDNPDIRFREADEDANKGESYKSGSVSTYSLPKSLAKSLHAASPNASAFVAKSGDAILLSELVIPKEERGGGSGSAFMAELTRYADENGMNIVLTADGDYGGSKIGQQRFYRRHGFVPNAGRNKDFRYRENMIRRPADAIRYNVADDGQWQSTEPGLLDDVIYKLQHKQIDTRRTVQAITKAIGDIADKYNPELKESLYHGRAANETRKFLDFELRPITRRMIALGVDTPTLETFLWARHAEERNAHIAKINPRMPDGGSGLTNAQAKQLLAGNDVTINGETIAGVPHSKLDELGELSAMADAMLDKSRELLVENGLETRATIDAWKSDYPHYVPLHREEFEDDRMTGRGLGMSVKGPSGKRAIGSDKPVGNILAAIVSQRELYITRAEKNRVGNALYGLATTAPNEEFWKAVDPAANANRDAEALWAQIKQRMTKLASMPNGDPDLEAIIDGMKAQHKAMMKKAIPGMKKVVDSLVSLGLPAEMAERVLAEPKELAINPRTGMVVERVNPLLRHLDNVVATRINGRDVFVVFDARDKRASRMAIAMKNLDADQLGFLLGNMAKATRYFAAINTQFNPIFGVTNFVRDIQTAMLNLSSTPLADHKKEVATRSLSAMRGIYSDLRAQRAGNLPSSKWAAMFERFKQAGGATGYRDMFETLSDRSKALQDELKKMSMSKGRRLFTLGQSNPVFAWLSDYNEMMENSVRVAAFSVGIEQGLSDDQAASLAKELTVNFNKKGQVAAQAGAMYAFFNAAVQGSARIAQTLFVNRDGKVSLSSVGKKIVSGGIMIGVAQAFLGALAGWDDEEPPQFVRERSLIIPLGDHYFSVPMPLGFNVLPNIGRITAEFAISGFKDPAKRIGSLLNVLADTLNPIGNAGVSLQTIAPTVIDPLAALAENKDWTGKPIKRMSFNEEAAGYKNAKDTATVWSKWIAEGLNYLSGGTEHKAGLSSPTPDQIDYLIGQVTGGVGREISKAVQSSTSVFSGEDLPLYKVPLVGKFVGDTKGNAADASRFYANVRELKAHKAELDGRRKAGQDVAEYLRDNPDARLVVLASRIERRVQELRRSKRELVDQGAPKDRVNQAEDQIAALMKALNSRVQANQRAA